MRGSLLLLAVFIVSCASNALRAPDRVYVEGHSGSDITSTGPRDYTIEPSFTVGIEYELAPPVPDSTKRDLYLEELQADIAELAAAEEKRSYLWETLGTLGLAGAGGGYMLKRRLQSPPAEG